MDFKEALVIVNEVLPETLGRRYDGILVKRLEASNKMCIRDRLNPVNLIPIFFLPLQNIINHKLFNISLIIFQIP